MISWSFDAFPLREHFRVYEWSSSSFESEMKTFLSCVVFSAGEDADFRCVKWCGVTGENGSKVDWIRTWLLRLGLVSSYQRENYVSWCVGSWVRVFWCVGSHSCMDDVEGPYLRVRFFYILAEQIEGTGSKILIRCRRIVDWVWRWGIEFWRWISFVGQVNEKGGAAWCDRWLGVVSGKRS